MEKGQHLKTKVRRTLRRLIGQHDYSLKELSGNEEKRVSSAYHKENQMAVQKLFEIPVLFTNK